MTLFVDASALVAMITGELEQAEFATRVREDRDPLWSAMTRWETVAALCRNYGYPIERARQETEDFARSRPFRLVEIGALEAELALDAYQRYGKGVDPAGLNLGDCFSYACAKANGAALLYKGNDFAKTDLA